MWESNPRSTIECTRAYPRYAGPLGQPNLARAILLWCSPAFRSIAASEVTFAHKFLLLWSCLQNNLQFEKKAKCQLRMNIIHKVYTFSAHTCFVQCRNFFKNVKNVLVRCGSRTHGLGWVSGLKPDAFDRSADLTRLASANLNRNHTLKAFSQFKAISLTHWANQRNLSYCSPCNLAYCIDRC